MTGRQAAGDGIPPSLAGMSKNQLYDIMTQMKTLIEQNKQQARQILIQNPALTKALFQAQIMLGMVPSPQAAPVITSPASSNPQPQLQNQQSNVQATPSFSAQGVINQERKQQPNVLVVSNSQSLSVGSSNPLSMPSHHLQLQQSKGNLGATSLTQSSQVPTQLPQHIASQPPSLLQQISTQSQQPMQNAGGQYLPLQSTLQTPIQPPTRPPMQGYPHQAHGQVGPSMGFQHGAAQPHHSQHMFRQGTKPPGNIGPSFPSGQLQLPNQPMNQSAYQAGSPHSGLEFNPTGLPKPADRLSTWPPALHESSIGQLPPPPPPFSAQAGPSNLPPRPANLTPELEKALLQQVMSLTPEQINMLPTDQRNQVFQLQQMLRQ